MKEADKPPGGCRVMKAVSKPPEGCMVDWVETEDDGKVRVCNGERWEGMVGALGGSQVVWHGSEVA